MSTYELSPALRLDVPPRWSAAAQARDAARMLTLAHEDASLGDSIVVTETALPPEVAALGPRALAERLADGVAAELEHARRSPVRQADAGPGKAHIVVVEGRSPGSELTARRVVFVWLADARLVTLTAAGYTDPAAWGTLSEATDHVVESLQLAPAA